jgi:hypothetical protein
LALAADELSDARQRVANDLEASGYVVQPSSRLPDTVTNAEAAIREGLKKAVLSVHFIGDNEGAKPHGSNDGIVQLQLRVAREFSQRSRALPRVLWVPRWLPGGRERDPFPALGRFGGRMPGEEVHAEGPTDLSQMLRSRLASLSSPVPNS